MTKPPTTTEKALKLRAQVKKRKPKFVRQESWRYERLKENWRRPKGLDNKMRRKIKGWPPRVNVGYRGPKVARGLHPSGYKEVLVHNVEEIKKVDPKTQAVRIAHTVGKRERAKILTESRKRRITVLNIKEVVKEEKLEKEEEAEEKEKPKQKRKRKEKPKGRSEEQ
jgi:large subunit ribosomal protein L32e